MHRSIIPVMVIVVSIGSVNGFESIFANLFRDQTSFIPLPGAQGSAGGLNSAAAQDFQINSVLSAKHYIDALGLGSTNLLEGCQENGVTEDCMQSIQNNVPLIGSFTKLLPPQAKKDIKLCKDQKNQKKIKDWIELLAEAHKNPNAFGQAAKQACRQQICEKLRSCEATYSQLCDNNGIMSIMSGRGSLADLLNPSSPILQGFVETYQQNEARAAVGDSCEQLGKKDGVENIFNRLIQSGTNQVAAEAVQNPGGALQTGGGLLGIFGQLAGKGK